MTLKVSVEEIKSRIHEIHGEQVQLDETSYVRATYKVRMFDSQYGEYVSKYNKSHPERVKLQRKATNILRYGHPAAQSKNVRDKIKNTNNRIYGCDSPGQNLDVQERIKKTSLERYGTERPSQSKEVRDKISLAHSSEITKNAKKMTCLERYGVDHVSKVPLIRQKQIQTINEIYGCDNALQNLKVRAKRNATIQDRYGTPEYVTTTKFKIERKKSLNERYGVNSPLEHPKFSEKAHQTMKRNGSYRQSRTEDEFFKILTIQFGDHDVERQIMINKKWSIDFHVKSINTYVQFDGVYWHGLDRSLDEIKKFKTSRDVVILRKYETDREQDFWFRDNSLNLVRFTDAEVKTAIKQASIHDLIASRLTHVSSQ